MNVFFGILAAAGGMFLLFWYRTIVSLPVAVRPRLVRRGVIKWGVPGLSLAVFAGGLALVAVVRPGLALWLLIIAGLAGFALIRFDRYSAQMRVIHDRYLRIRAGDKGLTEAEALYLTARWRYPAWSHDRLVEVSAGKDIESLMLMMVIRENRIHPISDWELYRTLRKKAARIK